MKLWHLLPRNPKAKPWLPWYDKVFGVVVRAENEAEARTLAAGVSGDEGPKPWFDIYLTVCNELRPEGESGLICRDLRGA